MRIDKTVPVWQFLTALSDAFSEDEKAGVFLSAREVCTLREALDHFARIARLQANTAAEMHSGLAAVIEQRDRLIDRLDKAQPVWREQVIEQAAAALRGGNVVQLGIIPRPIPQGAWQNREKNK